ncbi:MAG: prolyl oligopeptidase family serine peptidase [Prevotella sp.]|nr:prolyl oligopeptidase family serine peptidase [Prevotella sp.]
MKRIHLLIALTVMLTTATTAFGQKKEPVQKREKFEFTFDLPAYVEQLKQELTYPLSWENSGIKSFKKWQKKARQKVFDCMLTPPKAAAAFDMQVVAEEQREGYRALRIAFNQNAYSRIEALVLVPDGEGPFPAVNLLHDHGAHLYIGKEKMIRPFGVEQAVIDDADAWAKNLYGSQYVGDYLARHGYVCFSADAPMWGERGREEGVDRSKYDIIAGNMMMLGRDLCGFMHYDDITATEFLATLPWVDPQRIGCMGCSMGAYRAWMLSAMSDRIKAGASICWMVTADVQMSVEDGKREYGGFANCLPGLRQWLDYPDIASLAAPKPMLFINGTKDHLFPVRGVKKAFEQMHQTWRRLGADDRLKTELWEVPHSCGVEIQKYMLDFFNQNL